MPEAVQGLGAEYPARRGPRARGATGGRGADEEGALGKHPGRAASV